MGMPRSLRKRPKGNARSTAWRPVAVVQESALPPSGQEVERAPGRQAVMRWQVWRRWTLQETLTRRDGSPGN